MWSIGSVGFASPLLLLGVLALPLLVLLLRAVPPAPILRRFPGVVLLLGLKDKESQTDRTPWWLLLIRLLAVAAIIVGFAGPVLNPRTETTGPADALLILVDGTWADAPYWDDRKAQIGALVDQAERDGRTTALVSLTDLPPTTPEFFAAALVKASLSSLNPNPWEPVTAALEEFAANLDGSFDTYWLSDGIQRDGNTALISALTAAGNVTVYDPALPALGLRTAQSVDGVIQISMSRSQAPQQTVSIRAMGLDPAGIERVLAQEDINLEAGTFTGTTSFELPSELRNRLTRFEIAGQNSAGAVTLTGDALRRREVALIDGGLNPEELELLSPLHYLREALEPSADLIAGTLDQILEANPDVIVLADVTDFVDAEERALTEWVQNGGMLLRFAGPRMAASDLARTSEAPLMPVRLRSGGRTIGGAMSWGEPKTLAPFSETSPFFGLQIPSDVAVSSQVLAQPDPSLANRVIAQLADGTPLVTRATNGLGQIVLFHVTANADWSTLPLSGLFVQMLERLALASGSPEQLATDLAGGSWTPEQVMDAFGVLERIDTLAGVDGDVIALGTTGPDLLPGIYTSKEQSLAVNVIATDRTLAPAQWPSEVRVLGTEPKDERDLKGLLLSAALLLLAIDVLLSLLVSGRLRGGLGIAVFICALPYGMPAEAQDDAFALEATAHVVLAHVMTGDPKIDDVANAGLAGLSRTLFQRTSVEPAAPMGVDIEKDDIALFPFLYWPVTASQPIPSRAAYAKLNAYLRTGGMILFDTRDADIAGFGGSTPEGQKLRAIALGLDIPALEPIPEDHVLTRTFYLLQAFPGRYNSRDIWVEAAKPGAELVEGMPFRNLNDGVTPVVIGGNDWASAWALDERGGRMFPVGRGMAGEQQREIAYRFGVNLIMHVLTGNYKSDQVHVPALLDRLGQ